MPSRHATSFTSNDRRVLPLGKIARIVSSLFERPDRSTQFGFSFRHCVGHSLTIGPTGHGKTIALAFGRSQGRFPQSIGAIGFNEVVLASPGSGMSLPRGTLVQHRFDFVTNVDASKHRSILGPTRDRPSPLALDPSRGQRSDLLILDDAWYEASPENPYAIPKSAFMAAAKPNRHDG